MCIRQKKTTFKEAHNKGNTQNAQVIGFFDLDKSELWTPDLDNCTDSRLDILLYPLTLNQEVCYVTPDILLRHVF